MQSVLVLLTKSRPCLLKNLPAGPVQLSNTSIVPSLVPGLAAAAPVALGAQRLLCTVATTTYNMLVGSNNYCVVRQTTNVTAYAIWRHALWRTCPSSLPYTFFLSNLTHAGKSIKEITKPYYFSPNKLIRSGPKKGGLNKVDIRLSYNAWASRDHHVDFSLVIAHSTKLVH